MTYQPSNAELHAIERAERLAEQAAAARYRNAVPDMRADDLLDALMRSAVANTYGSHTEQIAILRTELLARLAGPLFGTEHDTTKENAR